MKDLDVILDPLDKLGLVFPDGPPDVGPDKQGVEPGEDPNISLAFLAVQS